jgi:hypothetical protein
LGNGGTPGTRSSDSSAAQSLVAPTWRSRRHCVLNIPVPAIGFNPANQFEAITGRTVLYLSDSGDLQLRVKRRR